MPSTEEIKKEIEYLFDKALNSGLTEQEKIHIKSKLEEVGEDFVRECKNFIGSINSLSPAEIATRVISQVIKKAKDQILKNLIFMEQNQSQNNYTKMDDKTIATIKASAIWSTVSAIITSVAGMLASYYFLRNLLRPEGKIFKKKQKIFFIKCQLWRIVR